MTTPLFTMFHLHGHSRLGAYHDSPLIPWGNRYIPQPIVMGPTGETANVIRQHSYGYNAPVPGYPYPVNIHTGNPEPLKVKGPLDQSNLT
jgi:hypothetical protein